MTTTTTEAPRPLRGRGRGAGRLRAYLIALLAAVYLIAWWAFGAQPVPSAQPSTPVPRPEPRSPEQHAPQPDGPPSSALHRRATTAWYHELAPAARPRVRLPPGWHIAHPSARHARPIAREPAPAAPPAPAVLSGSRVPEPPVVVPVRVSPERRYRVRTRSS